MKWSLISLAGNDEDESMVIVGKLTLELVSIHTDRLDRKEIRLICSSVPSHPVLSGSVRSYSLLNRIAS